jgi:hypothetical protein
MEMFGIISVYFVHLVRCFKMDNVKENVDFIKFIVILVVVVLRDLSE